ncbi:MAG: CHAD domain-containing protein, partial [Streptomyces sp.]|uniref:CHAD domain-containing protein n=1 Tax=Streptomyces sp. TaxID=1931 RepID=UPI003D6AF49D
MTGATRVPIPQVPAPPARPASLVTATTAEVLGGYLHGLAAEFLRGLRLHGESVGSAETATSAAGAVHRLSRAARRLRCTLQTYRPLLDTGWADQLCGELHWLSGALGDEYEYAARLDRLLGALHRLPNDGVGAARAGALLERQLNLARTRAHSAALQALVSGRFHAVADAVAVLAYEAQLTPGTADGTAAPALVPLAEEARGRLTEAVGALPHIRAGAEQDAAWHQVRRLLRLHRYAEETLRLSAGPSETGAGGGSEPSRLRSASAALDRHRDAAEAAAAATAAART